MWGIKKNAGRNLWRIFRHAYLKKTFLLLDTAFAQFFLPFPGRSQCIGQCFFSSPSQYLIGTFRISPNFFDITFATTYDFVRNFYTGNVLISSNTVTPLPVPRLKYSTFSSVLPPSIRSIAITCAFARSTTLI